LLAHCVQFVQDRILSHLCHFRQETQPACRLIPASPRQNNCYRAIGEECERQHPFEQFRRNLPRRFLRQGLLRPTR
jgi:hypothetical protein